jgi:beta-exotoxin I transport system permease protein
MIAILKWALWRRRWFIFWWALGVMSYMALVLLAYPSFRGQAATLNNSLNQLPQAVRSLVADTNNFLSPIGYMSSNVYYLLLPLLFGILTIGLGSSLLARDEADHTLELVLSRPISRGRVLVARALAGLVITAAVLVATIIATVLFAWMINLGISYLRLAAVTLMAARMALIFGALAFMLAAFGRMGRVISVGVPTLLFVVSYLFTSLAGTVHWLKWPAKLLPYQYFHPSEILAGNYNWPDAFGMVATILVLGIISYLAFRKRDIA